MSHSFKKLAKKLYSYGRQGTIRATLPPTKPLFNRKLCLQRFLGLNKKDIETLSINMSMHIIQRLSQSLREERQRGRTAHWSYDINRHLALLQTLRNEQTILSRLNAKSPRKDYKIHENRSKHKKTATTTRHNTKQNFSINKHTQIQIDNQK